MRSVPHPQCPVCSSNGESIYGDLSDRLYGAPGQWHMRRCVSRQCGALWLDPAPHPEDLSAAYVNYYTHRTPGQVHAGFRANVRDAFASRTLGYKPVHSLGERLASWLYVTSPRRSEWALYSRFYLPWTSGGRLLEIGCGSGGQLALMARAGWNASGLDFDPEAVAVAKSRGLDVAVGDVRDLGYPDASFDAIVMTHVIEHIVDPVGVLTECRRILKPTGTLAIVTPNPASLGHRVFKRAWRGLEPPRHLVVFTPEALRLASRKAGFVVCRVIYSARDAANLFLSSERLRDARKGERIRLPEANLNPPLRLRGLENLERLACWIGLPWGEEQILLGRPAHSPSAHLTSTETSALPEPPTMRREKAQSRAQK